MKKKIIVGGVTLLALFFLPIGISHAHGPYARRHHFQMERIAHGFRSGEVTEREFRYLSNEQRQIQRRRRRFLADGWLSRGERRRLYRMQNRADRDIYQARHNQRKRGCSCSSGHVVRPYARRRFTCSDHDRFRVAQGDSAWGWSGFFYDRW